VRDVRMRLARGESAVPTGSRPTRTQQSAAGATDVTGLVSALSKDPALRMNAAGRELLRWLHTHTVDASDSSRVIEASPDHCLGQLIEIANRCAANWAALAEVLRSARDGDLRTG
jgi:hypothetical protein